jgi:glutathione S-transferase
VPYSVEILKGRPASSTRKAPYAAIDGKVLADSSLIIAHLERTMGHPVDGKLTLSQRAEALAMQRLMEEHLYWVAVYMRWVDPETRAQWRPYMQQLLGLPGWTAPVVSTVARRQVTKILHAQGIGRHPPDVIWQLGITDVQALAHWLGARSWAFGDQPTSIDACLAAFIGNILRTPWNNPLTAATAKHTNLAAHFERLMARCFPELAA